MKYLSGQFCHLIIDRNESIVLNWGLMVWLPILFDPVRMVQYASDIVVDDIKCV